MSDPIGYNGSGIDMSGFGPCTLCGATGNCKHRGGTTSAVFERRGHVGERDNGEPERQGPSDRAMWDFVKSKPPPSARGSVTVRRSDGTTITCDIAQLQEVLEQVHKVRPRPIEITCTASNADEISGTLMTVAACSADGGYLAATPDRPGSHLGNTTQLDSRGVEHYMDGPCTGMSVDSEVDWSYGHRR